MEKMNSEDDFKKWQYGFRLKIQHMQPYYFSNKEKPDAVIQELERLDRLEQVVEARDTKWVEDLCAELQRK
jgi:hypothetical protein